MNKKNIAKVVHFLEKHKPSVLTAIFLSILGDIFFLKESSDVRIFGVILVYICSIWLYKLSSKLTFTFALWVLCVMFFLFLFTSTSENTEKAAVWLFFLIAIGIFQQLKE